VLQCVAMCCVCRSLKREEKRESVCGTEIVVSMVNFVFLAKFSFCRKGFCLPLEAMLSVCSFLNKRNRESVCVGERSWLRS